MSSSVSKRSSLWFLAITLLSFLAASTAPTPLYHLYQDHLQFSAATLTLIFGVYALSLLAALLTVGSLSDYLGRKPVIFTAVLLNMLAMLLFINADSVTWLISARVLQGFATGMATAALGAALLDTDRQQGPLVNSVAPLLGMAVGAMGCGLLAEFAPLPLQLTFWVLLALFGLQALYVWRLPESVSAQSGALASLRPTLHVPVQARRALWRVLPINTATWALGGFYASLAPSLVRTATGSTSNLIGGATVAVLTVTGALMIYTLRSRAADKVLWIGTSTLPVGVALILLAVHSASLPLFFIGTLVAGGGLRVRRQFSRVVAQCGATGVAPRARRLDVCVLRAQLPGVLPAVVAGGESDAGLWSGGNDRCLRRHADLPGRRCLVGADAKAHHPGLQRHRSAIKNAAP